MESLQCETLALLYQLPLDKIFEVCWDLGIHTTETWGKLKCINLITTYLASEDGKKDNEGETTYRQLKRRLTTLMPPEAQNRVHGTEMHHQVAAAHIPDGLHTWRKDFKIFGQIGEPGQKDKLSYSSLIRQIDTGLTRGFTEKEVIEGVIRAINPGLEIRSYVEGRDHSTDWRETLTLVELRKILFSHYHEKTATELYQELCTLTQRPKEDAMTFLIRGLDMRQKVMFASEQNDEGIRYSPELVQGMFLHALQTGLMSEFIRQELRATLEKPNAKDEELISSMNKAVSMENERRQRSHTKVRSNLVDVDSEGNDVQSAKLPKKGGLVAEVKELQAELSEIRGLRYEVSALKEQLKTCQIEGASKKESNLSDGWREGRRDRRRGCPQCKETGNGYRCDHCFCCGSSEHFLAGCRKYKDRYSQSASTQQGNANRLQRRD